MNPLPPHLMTSTERLAALCNLLALGLVRLRMGTQDNYLKTLEKVAYTSCPTRAHMQLPLIGDPHDNA